MLPGACGCCRVLPGAAECCRVLLGAAECCRVLAGAARCCWVPPGATGWHQVLPGAHVVRVHMSNRARTQHFTIGAVHTWRLINIQKVTELAIALWNSETNPDSFWAGKDSTPNSFAQRRL